jgi:radical SAM superfamily enzyme YgiQ (UPF0313 family)
MSVDRQRLLDDERSRLQLPRHGSLRVAVGYPNTYHVAQSSLAFQWVVEIAAGEEDLAVDRFYADDELAGRSFESSASLASFDVLAWSSSFELDGPNLLRALDSAGIPRHRERRGPRFPLLVVGGAVASINPLPLASAVDVFVLGAAELLWPQLLRLARQYGREALLEELAGRDGYFVPEHHLDTEGRPLRRLRRLEKRDVHMADSELVPCSHVVTPNTEYVGRGLIEMSRGCPEKCRYCWVSYNYGRLRCYPEQGILDRVHQLRDLTDRIGFVATAVGDHPRLAEILAACRAIGMNVALSSLRIPAMVPPVLRPLAESGARSVTIAPETGTDSLRASLNKPITNARILEAVEDAQRCGIPSLKMYFIVGLPGETDEDLEGIVSLVRDAAEIVREWGRQRGRVGTLHAGFSILVPKPYTPYSRERMLDAREAKRRLQLIWNRLRGTSNLRLDRPSYREALWQGYLSRGGCEASRPMEMLADGAALSQVMAEHRAEIEAIALSTVEGEPLWRFISSAPSPARSAKSTESSATL